MMVSSYDKKQYSGRIWPFKGLNRGVEHFKKGCLEDFKYIFFSFFFPLVCQLFFLRPGSTVHCIYVFSLPQTLVKTLAKNLIKNLAKHLDKSLSKIM